MERKPRGHTKPTRSNSSNRWMHEHVTDHFVQEAKKLGYRSRSAFKILEIDEKCKLFKRGMTVVDLGAAPGGWTWQLVNRGMLVTAIDNGPMAESLMETGLVQHLMADGFTFVPKQPVDWMVCDIVEKPARNAALLETWIGEGYCREAVVNLKLPMKQRYAEVKRLLERIEDGFKARGIRVEIGCKQLYHDREEVTCHLRRLVDVKKTKAR